MDDSPTPRKIEEILNKTSPGLVMLYRDADLGTFGSLYRAGMVIREKGYTDASRLGGGLVTTHRYVILSNHFFNAAEFESGNGWGLCILQRDSYFKVLDVYERQGKILITLLHVPDETWQIIDNVGRNLDKLFIEMSRMRFDEHLFAVPIPALTVNNWRKRCLYPLGLNDKGEWFPLVDQANH